MKCKILFLIVILLIGITAVSAENNTSTFADVQSAIDGDAPIVYLNNSDYVGDGKQLAINRDIIIDGAYENNTGSSTLNANGLSRIIEINNNYSVILKNINFINGLSDENGGAILLNGDGKLIICNCNFSNNYGNYGGAIYSGGSLNVFDGYFTNNSCLMNGSEIYCESDSFYLLNSQFDSPSSAAIDVIVNDEKLNLTYANYQMGDNEFGFIGSSDYNMLMYNPLYNGSFPSRFSLKDLGYVSPVLHQGSTGTCWAHALISTLQSCMMKANGADLFDLNSWKNTLSVANLVNVIMEYINPSVTYDSGAFFRDAIPYLVSWIGPVYDDEDYWTQEFHHSEILDTMIHVQNCYKLPDGNGTNLQYIKQALMDYGAIWISFSAGNYCTAYGDYFNPKYDTSSRHAVTLVGWDDNYSRYNFNPVNGAYPEGDGAFIVQNSWGKYWGRNGFFYISYYDKSVAYTNMWTFIFNDTLRYDKNYQNEIRGESSNVMARPKTAEASNSFQATDDEYLVAVSTSFYTGYDYEIQISLNGKSVLNQTGTKISGGYYTIELDKYIPLKTGDEFTVKFIMHSVDGEWARVHLDVNLIPVIKAYTSKYIIESIQNKVNLAKDNSEIFLDNKTYFASLGEKTVIINKNITINGAKSNGQGFSTVDGNNLISLFEIAKGCNVILKNINIINSKGTAVLIDEGGILTVLDSNFSNNFGEYGNSIIINGNGTIVNCIFINGNPGVSEIFVNGTASLKNNIINSNTPGIYNNGTIESEANLVFNDANGIVNKELQLTATLTDDNGNSIKVDSLSIDNFGEMSYSGNVWSLDYVPTNVGQYALSGSPKGFKNLKVKEGILSVNLNNMISITGGEFTYGTTPSVIIGASESQFGDYNVYVDGLKISTVKISSKTTSLGLGSLNAGNHVVKLEKVNDIENTNSARVSILQAQPTLSISAADVEYGGTAIVNVRMVGVNNAPLSGAISINVNGRNYNLNLVGGSGVLPINDLSVNSYLISASFAGNENYLPAVCQADFDVFKKSVNVNLDDGNLKEGEITVSVSSSKATGEVYLYVDGNLYDKKALSDGAALFKVDSLSPGKHNVAVSYAGDNNHNPASDDYLIHVSKIKATVAYEVVNNVAGDTLIKFTGPNDDNSNLRVSINGKYYDVDLVEGIGFLDLNELNHGDYQFTAKYTGDNYEADDLNNLLTVLPRFKLESGDITMAFKDGTSYRVTLLDAYGTPISGVKVSLILNGPSFKNLKYDRVTDSNGVASLPIGLSPGSYSISANYDSVSIENSIKVNANSYSLVGKDISMAFKDGTSYKVTLLDGRGNPVSGVKVSLILNGPSFKNLKYNRVTDSNGVASLPIGLSAGSYTVTAQYGEASVTNKINVGNKGYTLVSKDINMVFKDGTSYKVTLLDGSGNSVTGAAVTVSIDGGSFKDLKYNRVTDSNGVASLPIGLSAGQYTFKATFNGATISNKVVVSSSVVVSSYKLVASDVVKYYKTSTPYTVKLLDNGAPLANKVITVVLNGASFKDLKYSIKTDSNGVATLPIGLIAGDYTIAASFNGVTALNKIKILKAA
ncbi:MAG: Ig-like domain repeat protein [Methanobrevibacter sp.]|uniref:Ig-like domain repeat protein n=1 Tax=Methanobrevibacter sp. TaxID=66852 RepID=UPI0026DF3DEC|nr:Ig-like domain repeat protein [Methanobrevibacter sp.]MDO5848539.1 Ig-like domain repeat protein [Methanobrevibacter sp.]